MRRLLSSTLILSLLSASSTTLAGGAMDASMAPSTPTPAVSSASKASKPAPRTGDPISNVAMRRARRVQQRQIVETVGEGCYRLHGERRARCVEARYARETKGMKGK